MQRRGAKKTIITGSTTAIGRRAERYVASNLHAGGHRILSLNWRSRWCEIDIVSTYNGSVYFTEVKYRSSDRWGEGVDYVGGKKRAQMKFAAEFWMHCNGWSGDALLQVASVSGDFKVKMYLIDS